jgi:hypothetical protein
MIFPKLNLETVLQVEDKTRLNASRSFVSSGSITDVLIEPELGAGFISVFNSDEEKWFLDWAYQTDGEKTVTVRVETDTPSTRDVTYSITVLSRADDSLFSCDSDIIGYEPDILNYLPRGKNSYLYAHRKAQDIIIAYLDEQRIWNEDGSRISKAQIAAITDNEIREQFRQWSTYQTLLIIFNSIQVSNEDIFEDKKRHYEMLMNSARKRSALRLDRDKDDVIDSQAYDIRTVRMLRR